MQPPSLHEIEHSLSQLWLKESERKKLSQNKSALRPEIVSSVDKKGVALYAALLDTAQLDLMESIYPYCASVLRQKWDEVVREYFVFYPPNHYNLNRAAQRFPVYLNNEGAKHCAKLPYLAELADYEWVEMELLEKDEDVESQPQLVLDHPEQFLKFGPVINPVLSLRSYRYPVQKIVEKLDTKSALRGIKATPCYMVICRNPKTNNCKYLEVGELAYEIIQATIDSTHTYGELISLAVSRAPYTNPEETVADFLELNEKLQGFTVFVGSKSVSVT